MASKIKGVGEPSVQTSPTLTGVESNAGRLELVGKVEGYDDSVNMAVIVPREEGVICISDDRTVKVWMKRYTGQYWPSICHNVPGACVSMDFCTESRQLVVGLDCGVIMEFKVGDDYNKIQHTRDYSAHTGRVASVHLVEEKDILLSCGADKCFQLHCTETGRRLMGYQLNASGSCIQYDASSSYMFIGDSSGQITVLKLQNNTLEKVTILKRHTATVQCMTIDKERHLLFSGSHDMSIIVWNIKSASFSAFELHGHLDKVRGLSFCESSNQLLSVGEDCALVCWDMTKPRDPAATWTDSGTCEKCSTPFFWNVKSMWEMKTFGGRQHHCRKCGKALCAKCTTHNHTIPNMGFELQVRVCDQCHQELEDERQASMASFHDLRHSAVYMDIDDNSKTLLTVGKDRLIKLWDASSILRPQVGSAKPQISVVGNQRK